MGDLKLTIVVRSGLLTVQKCSPIPIQVGAVVGSPVNFATWETFRKKRFHGFRLKDEKIGIPRH